MSIVQTIRPEEGLTQTQAESIYAVASSIWPGTAEKPWPSVEDTWSRWQAQGSAHFVIAEDAQVLAHSLIFPRVISTIAGPITVGALATVFVHPDFRGRGWGVAVVKAAFDYLPEINAPLSLFQTGVPEFYAALGARRINNRFVNGDRLENPFWDTCEMIYPGTAPWPEGTIDLNGPGY
jgi:GNAT superfamily N-acetyltransferase